MVSVQRRFSRDRETLRSSRFVACATINGVPHMPPYVLAYLGSAAAMLVLDIVWLTLAVPRLYQPALGQLLADKPNLTVAGVFYLLYLVGVVVFAVLPALDARSWLHA